MKNILTREVSLFIVAFLAFSIVIGISLPSFTSAATNTAQLLPVGGGNSCGSVAVTGFTPYIYEGALHSFEFTVSDPSYVGITGSVGNKNIPFNQITRRVDPGSVRIHADVPTTVIRGNLTVSITMLSATGAREPVCITIYSTGISAAGSAQTPTPAPTPVPTPAPIVVKPTTPTPAPQTPTPAPQPTTAATGTIKATTSTSPLASFQNALKDVCTEGGAFRLWLVLLVIYALIVVVAIVGQPQLPLALRSQEWIATAIVVPFLLLFAFWYFAEGCRTSAWIPVIATVIALTGLSAAFWERKGTNNVINLPSAKK